MRDLEKKIDQLLIVNSIGLQKGVNYVKMKANNK